MCLVKIKFYTNILTLVPIVRRPDKTAGKGRHCVVGALFCQAFWLLLGDCKSNKERKKNKQIDILSKTKNIKK